MSSHPVHRDRDRDNMARRQARALGFVLQHERDAHHVHTGRYRLLDSETNEPLLPATSDNPYPFDIDEVERWIADHSQRR